MNHTQRSRTPRSIGETLQNIAGVAQSLDVRPQMEVVDKENYPFKPIFPVLVKEAQAKMLCRYKHYEKAYNKKARQTNKANEILNIEILGLTEKAKNPKAIIAQQCNFASQRKNLNAWEYNLAVKAFNVQFGPTVPYRKIQPLRDVHETFFRLLVWEYADQLLKYSRIRQAANITYIRSVPPMDVNTKYLQNSKGPDGLFITRVHKNTLLNRKDRLTEAGVIRNKVYRGSKKGTLHYVAPEIFAVFDYWDEKMTVIENQQVTEAGTQKLCDTVLTTGTLSKSLIKRVVNNPVCKERSSCPADGFTGTPESNMQNPGTQTSEKSKPGPENLNSIEIPGSSANEGLNYGSSSSEKLRSRIIVTWKLAQNCSKLEFSDHTPINTDVLWQEVREGTMTRTEFREFLTKEIFKMASNLYQGKHIYPGEWVKAYRQFVNSVMRTRKGDVYHKDKALQVYLVMCHALTDNKIGAKKIANYSKFSFAPPSWYLDPQNHLPGSFAHWYKKTVERIKKKKLNVARTLADQKTTNEVRKTDYHNNRKLERCMQRYRTGKITLPELMGYVKDNLPYGFRQTLTERLARFVNGMKIV